MDEIERDELIRGLMLLVFDTAKKESSKNNAYGLSRYLEERMNISSKTLTRYYNGYVLNRRRERQTPYVYNLDSLSAYLGYVDFEGYCNRSGTLKDKIALLKANIELVKKLNKIKGIGFICSVVLFGISVFFISKYYKKNCMIWVDDHYEKIRCSGLDNEKKLNETELKEFIQVEVCKDSTFFIDGKPVIHYTRHNNDIDFFKAAGEHPIYDDVFTKPITQTIINSRVKDCDSVITN